MKGSILEALSPPAVDVAADGFSGLALLAQVAEEAAGQPTTAAVTRNVNISELSTEISIDWNETDGHFQIGPERETDRKYRINIWIDSNQPSTVISDHLWLHMSAPGKILCRN